MDMNTPIRLTADYKLGDNEVIPAGTIGIPVRFGSPEGRVEEEPPVPNNYHFPTLAGTPPWDHIVPIYSIDGVHAFGKYETLDWFDISVVQALTAAEPWRNSDQDFDNLTVEDAIKIVVKRLQDMHRLIHGVAPTPPEEPPHKTLVRYSPILLDYAVCHGRMRKAEAMREESENRAVLSQQSAYRSADEARKAKHVLNHAREALLKAMGMLEADPSGIVRERPAALVVKERWLVTRDFDLTEYGRGTIKAGAIVTAYENGGNALVTSDMWVGRSAGDVALLGWSEDTSWYEEQGFKRVWPPESAE